MINQQQTNIFAASKINSYQKHQSCKSMLTESLNEGKQFSIMSEKNQFYAEMYESNSDFQQVTSYRRYNEEESSIELVPESSCADVLSTTSGDLCEMSSEVFRLSESDLSKIRMCKNAQKYADCVLFISERIGMNNTSYEYSEDGEVKCFVTIMIPCLIKTLEKCGIDLSELNINVSDYGNCKLNINILKPYMRKIKMMVQKCKGCFNQEERLRGVVLGVFYRFLSDEFDTIGMNIERTMVNSQIGLENLWEFDC